MRTPDYDLIILDIMMPGMDGVAACTEIRQHSVAPILFLTAKAQPADMSDAYGSGGDDYLIKPFSNHELFLRVDSLIRRYRVYHGKGDAPTVIDALQIVLLGETNARNFNLAANERSQRTLDGYLRADMDENNPRSRRGKDFSSYIACEVDEHFRVCAQAL